MDKKIPTAPTSIGVIMDGNRRWAKARGVPTLLGHRAGYKKLREFRTWAMDAGVKEIIVYAFSTENWNRTKEEVGFLMDLFREVIDAMVADAIRDNMRIIFLGERSQLPEDIVRAIESAEAQTKNFDSFCYAIALSYGGRGEIIDAIHRIPENKRATITEEEFSKLLWTKEMHDPDIIIRTSGEERLSNFLPWQSVYTELVFTKTLWPDFTEAEFHEIIQTYAARERRLGK